MSRFLVCWHRGGDAVPAAIVAEADRWRARDGRTPPRRLLRDDVACWHWPSEWAPGAEEALPLERQGWIGGGVLRLDDRGALDHRLRDRGVDGACDDASLAWRSFVSWGDDAPRAWIGDFSLAVVAPGRDRLVVARSAIGVRACFVASVGALSCVSDDLALLVALTGGRRDPPDEAVAEYLRFGQLMTPTLTFQRGVQRVPSAHTFVLRRDGTSRSARHWDLPRPDIRHGAPAGAILEEFRAILDGAVADRLRGPRGTLLLSGGLDSPAIALAARRAAPQVALRAFTVDWSRLIEDDEVAFARVAAAASALPLEVVQYAPAEGLDGGEPFTTPEPAPDPEPRIWRAQSARLAAYAPIVLLGEDPDTLLAAPTLTEQMQVDGFSRTARAWVAHLRATGERPWVGARRSVPTIERWRDARQARAPRWLRAPFASMGAAGPPPADPHPTRERAARALRHPLWDANAWLDDPAMTGVDLTVLLPFMDTRMIRFCFSLPALPWLQRKHLLRQALRGLVPDVLVHRPKTALTGYYAARVAAWRRLGSPAPLPAPIEEWVDPGAWARTLARSQDADEVFAAWRVLELSRWVAQPGMA